MASLNAHPKQSLIESPTPLPPTPYPTNAYFSIHDLPRRTRGPWMAADAAIVGGGPA